MTGVQTCALPISSTEALSAGKHVIKYEFIFDGGEPGAGGKCILYVDGQQAAEGQIPKTEAFAFSGDEGVDVGLDGETDVSNDYPEGGNKFTGKIEKVTVELVPTDSATAASAIKAGEEGAKKVAAASE